MEVAKRYDALRLRALRIPMYSCERLTEILSKSDEEIDEFIKDLCFNEFFLEAILIASGTLYDDVIKLRNGEIHEVKKIINIKISLLEYYLRMCSRTTPFGLFATPVFINNERKTKIAIQKVLHIDYQWCWQFSKILEDIPDSDETWYITDNLNLTREDESHEKNPEKILRNAHIDKNGNLVVKKADWTN